MRGSFVIQNLFACATLKNNLLSKIFGILALRISSVNFSVMFGYRLKSAICASVSYFNKALDCMD